jgi:ATP-dependent HslUV protease ATP-binding subunit HslU
MEMTPKEIVTYLDDFIIGQKEAKKAIALALRSRWRRMRLEGQMRQEVLPKNILMIGPTGVGKTEIARRMARMMRLPFVKVEATKYTEVGFVGRDVESMVRDLVMEAVRIVREEELENQQPELERYIVERIAKEILPPLPKGASQEKLNQYDESLKRMMDRVAKGEVDHLTVSIEVSPKAQVEFMGSDQMPPELQKLQESFTKMMGNANAPVKKEVPVKEARDLLKAEASERLLDMEKVRREGVRRAEEGGIIFLDEMDKVAVPSGSGGRQSDPSKEGVQRDLLPIVEGSTVHTKYGPVKTDHTLFIAAGAFHVSKPSDLIAELQGRFPLRVELTPLSEEDLLQILTTPKNSLIKQYQALLETEGVDLRFSDAAIKRLAKLAKETNDKTEDIGARRLHTVLERVLEDVSFSADEHSGEVVTIEPDLVDEKLSGLIAHQDTARYIL